MSSTSPIDRLRDQLASIQDSLAHLSSLTQWVPAHSPTPPQPMIHSSTQVQGNTLLWISTDFAAFSPQEKTAVLQMHQSIHQAVRNLPP